jgi:hypothetical protein
MRSRRRVVCRNRSIFRKGGRLKLNDPDGRAGPAMLKARVDD